MSEIEMIPKVWGHELIIENTDLYCGKLLVFKEGHSSSFHYHLQKHETFFVQSGKVKMEWLDLEDMTEEEAKERYEKHKVNVEFLEAGMKFVLPQKRVHRVSSLVPESVIFEVSTRSEDSDSHRIVASV